MANMSVWPTNGADGSVATEQRWRDMGRVWACDGVVPDIGEEMACTYVANTSLTVKTGACWVDGHYCVLESQLTVTAGATGVAVVRFNPALNAADLLWLPTRDGNSTSGQWDYLIYEAKSGVGYDRRRFYRGGTRTLLKKEYAPGANFVDNANRAVGYKVALPAAWGAANFPVDPTRAYEIHVVMRVIVTVISQAGQAWEVWLTGSNRELEQLLVVNNIPTDSSPYTHVINAKVPFVADPNMGDDVNFQSFGISMVKGGIGGTSKIEALGSWMLQGPAPIINGTAPFRFFIRDLGPK